MSDFVLNVPEDVVAAAQEIAEATEQPLESVLLDRLKTALPLPVLPPDEEAELAALQQLSDDALWAMAHERLPEPIQIQIQQLMDKNSLGTITSDEYDILSTLVDRSQRLMLRKSEAAAILTRRGHKISPEAPPESD